MKEEWKKSTVLSERVKGFVDLLNKSLEAIVKSEEERIQRMKNTLKYIEEQQRKQREWQNQSG